jgi:threonine/homoserine/homoserine lactone efflux protein
VDCTRRGFGILVHVTYCLIGIGFIIEKSIVLFSIMKFAGAAYLIYLGSKALFHKTSTTASEVLADTAKSEITPIQALRMGFVTNALNPKATVLFVSLFTQVVGPNTSMPIKLLYGSEMFFFTLAWYLMLATVFGHIAQTNVMKWFLKYIEKVTGAVLIAFGVRLAFTRSH